MTYDAMPIDTLFSRKEYPCTIRPTMTFGTLPEGTWFAAKEYPLTYKGLLQRRSEIKSRESRLSPAPMTYEEFNTECCPGVYTREEFEAWRRVERELKAQKEFDDKVGNVLGVVAAVIFTPVLVPMLLLP